LRKRATRERGPGVEFLEESPMSLVKDEAIRLIESLPDDCTLEDIQYHLYVRQKVERGMAAIDEGRVVSQEDAERKVAEWAKSFGLTPH
jgi:predicted transcriptional regulator